MVKFHRVRTLDGKTLTIHYPFCFHANLDGREDLIYFDGKQHVHVTWLTNPSSPYNRVCISIGPEELNYIPWFARDIQDGAEIDAMIRLTERALVYLLHPSPYMDYDTKEMQNIAECSGFLAYVEPLKTKLQEMKQFQKTARH